MTDDEIHGLHVRGDAYVCSSRAEGWGIPVFDALAHGKTVISHNAGGLADFVNKDNSIVYGGMPTFFYDMPHSDPGLFTGLEQCFEPSPAELALNMRHFHLLKKGNDEDSLDDKHKEEWQSVLNRRQNAIQVGQKFDYRVVASQLVEQLEALFKSWKETGTAIYSPVQTEEPSLEEVL
jgi:glycosyltransferase involved in cell wall biosynthesis